MNKKHFGREPEHRMRCLDNKPRDRGDDTNTNVVKIYKNKPSNDPQVKSEAKNFYDRLRDQIYSKDLGEYLVKVEMENEKDIRDRGDTEKHQQQDKKILVDDKKPTGSKHIMSQMANPYGVRLSEKNLRKIHEKMMKVVEPLDIEKRRKLYKMYTFRKSSDDSNMNHEEKKDCSTKTGSSMEECQERSIYPQNQEVNDPPLVHIKHETCTTKHETIDESDEESFLTEGEQSPGPASSTEPAPKSKTQVSQEGVQTDMPSPPASNRPSALISPKKQKTLFLKTRHISPPPARPANKRKPIIRTLMTREGDSTRIYKSVSFVEQKKKAPLKIHVGPRRTSRRPTRTARTPRAPRTPLTPRTSGAPSPTHSQKSKHNSSSNSISDSANVSLRIVKHRNSPSNIQKLVMNRDCKNKSRRLRHTSPEVAVAPPLVTEVAKWAPHSVNEHTKPYYEAWVNTTLAAISSDNDKMRKEKERIIQEMQERLQYQASMSEDDFSDERYTGRIKVIHR